MKIFDKFMKKKEEPKDNEYSIRVICQNCKYQDTLSILKNTPVEDFIKDAICSNCGLKMFKEIFNHNIITDLFNKSLHKANPNIFADAFYEKKHTLLDDYSDEDIETGTLFGYGKDASKTAELTLIVSKEDLDEIKQFVADLQIKKGKKKK